MSGWIVYVAAGAAVVGVVVVLFVGFLAIPVGLPTVHLSPAERAMAAQRRRGLADVAPRGYVGWIERQIVLAGRQSQWSAGGFLAIKATATAVVALLAGGGVLLVPPLWWAALLLLALGLALPEVSLHARADDRQKAIRLALPDTLDQMTIAVEAGVGFDAAMAKAAGGGRGPLAEELIRTLQDISIGQSRREAFRALERRTSSDDLRRFIRAVVQADAYGISVADVLRAQAADMRVRRRQRAEEQAMKVPVKIVFPLVFCILPVLFIVVLAPAVAGLIRVFGNLGQ